MRYSFRIIINIRIFTNITFDFYNFLDFSYISFGDFDKTALLIIKKNYESI
jgi:hypothetical protein